MVESAYRANEPSRVRATDVPLRQRLIDEGLLRPDRNEPIAPEPRDRLMVVQLPPGTAVFRRWPRAEVLA